ncbi:telomere repeats-binding bouquet formation protein 1 isoform X1 [Xyrichtys novacula]|uniref:Telomere repeats-binding bouquet formation protein 1 isoform X1 n=1 Tax=Xyrichtys novacula TaxID=13765 RepID=A0AAV1F767_XYRNO|nr:telomere repeats-binding bouquet formation protein 1 isoform X1 [Xyrichtys novacula]
MAIKTDLSLLLECLKCQMKSPDLQKQALLTIHSICENKEENVDFLRQMGGVSFMYNLSKSSIVHPNVKEAALFTLSTLAEANVYCKNSLCRKETFSDLAEWLTKEDIPLTHKRVSVYLLSVLVANNKSGQTLAQTTGCLDILLDIFRTTFPLSTETTFRAVDATQMCQLWASSCSALCGCVNNPQNEEGQRICVAAFPVVKTWLQQIDLSRTEIFQSVCSFIAMTVANNWGLDNLCFALVQLASAADTSLLSCQLSVTLSKTLSACITDNPSLASGLAPYGVVSQLFFLLASPHLNPEERLSVLLTLGLCTVASEEHQSQLVQCGGLPLIITLLTEDTSEEVRKAATFILQTCKQASTREPIMSHEWSPEGGRAHQTADNKMFKLPATVKHSVPKETMREKYCEEELQDHRMSTVREMSMKRDSPSQIRCAGCVLPFEEVTSHTFSSLQNSCKHSCDMHKVLQEASERFRASHFLCKREHRDNSMNQAHQDSARLSAAAAAEPRRSRKNWSEVCLTPIHRATGKGKSFLSDNNWKKHNGITLTPLHRGATKETSTSHNRTGPGLNPLRRSRPAEDTERREEKSSGLRTLGDEMESHTDLNSSRRKRRDFSHSEVHYLLSGVETLGFSWNSILWSYPFQPGRTNVDLAKKYRQLMKAREANVDRA